MMKKHILLLFGQENAALDKYASFKYMNLSQAQIDTLLIDQSYPWPSGLNGLVKFKNGVLEVYLGGENPLPGAMLFMLDALNKINISPSISAKLILKKDAPIRTDKDRKAELAKRVIA